MRKIKIIYIICLMILINILLIGCSKKVEPISKTQLWLDTPCQVTIYDKSSNEVLNKAFDAIKNVHNKMNANTDNSEVANINKNAGIGYVKVSDETFYVISQAKKYGDITNGKFDISVGPLVKLWGINTENAKIPLDSEIKQNLQLVNYKDVLLDEKNKTVMLKNKGMSIDLGGIAKGYAADCVAKVLKENNVKNAIIDLGGNIIALGSKEDGHSWKIGIQNPKSDRGTYFGVIQIKDKAVVTSGIYERYFEEGGKIYHHIFDTSTGYPVDNNLESVTIISDISINGDALAKTFCLGVDKGLEFLKKMENVDAIFVTKDNKVYITDGIRDTFQITDTNFKLMN